MRQIGFDPLNADDLNKKPNPPKPFKADTPGKSTVAPPARPPAPIPSKPDMTKEDRMQAKVDELIEKLKRCNYPFDPDELKKEDQQTQLTMLQEMLYDVEMFQKKEQTPPVQ